MSFEEVSPSFTRESYRPPGVPPEIHTVHILGFVGCNISLILYGVALSIFVQCVKALVKTLKPSDPSHRTRVIQLAYACSIFTAGTLFIAADTWSNIISTLEYPLYPGGPVGWILEHYNHPVVVLGNVSFLLTTWLSDGFMMYRCYVIYTQTTQLHYVLILPLLLYLASWATGILLLVQVSAPHSSLFSQINFGIANLSVITSLHVTLTALISGKLLLHRIHIQKLLGPDTGLDSLKMYTSISTILIESSALYSGFALLFMVPFALDHPAAKFVLPLLAQIQVISPLLVAYRLTREMGWTQNTSRSISALTSGLRVCEPASTSSPGTSSNS